MNSKITKFSITEKIYREWSFLTGLGPLEVDLVLAALPPLQGLCPLGEPKGLGLLHGLSTIQCVLGLFSLKWAPGCFGGLPRTPPTGLALFGLRGLDERRDDVKQTTSSSFGGNIASALSTSRSGVELRERVGRTFGKASCSTTPAGVTNLMGLGERYGRSGDGDNLGLKIMPLG